MNCKTCGGHGYYMDKRCESSVCDHAGREPTKAQREAAKEDKTTVKEKARIMPCPSRPCSCPAGATERAKLQAKIDAQNELLALAATWAE